VALIVLAIGFLLSATFVFDRFINTNVQAFWTDFLIRALAVIVIISYGPFRAAVWDALHIRNEGSDPKSIFVMRIVLYIGCGLLVSLYVISYVNWPIARLFPGPPPIQASDMSTLYFLGEITLGMTMVAIEEEFTFRVIISKVVKNYSTSLVALYLSSALLFSLFHWPSGLGSVTGGFLAGLLYMFLYHRTGSIVPSIAVHYLHNFVILLEG
jgi:membrane protease YdiL (CAAX protease family)